MSLALTSATSSQQTQNLLQGRLLSSGSASSSSTTFSRQGQCTVYIGAEPNFSSDTQAVIKCFRNNNIAANESNPSSATHFFLFVTDSFLKSKELLSPLITRFVSDPHFKQRLFPLVMGKMSIFSAGQELDYMKYWTDRLQTLDPNSAEYAE